ncbi:hypothetical protein Vadar_018947 [Vaccinium darrowii]|uniref:Uncharacterized protein n=1 Tax=Vaccinium darrowii TaxID=229202 RepID=A0ACB7YWN2_9ERIC|nr:hypothetical protein Vadar_018947 [Vaccinium darrowii]
MHDYQRINPSRCAWISCYGVPLIAWHSETFHNIGKLMGEVIKLDEITAKSIAFGKGRMFIVTDQLQCINEMVDLKVKGEVYPIKIVEDPFAETSWENRIVTSIKVGAHEKGADDDVSGYKDDTFAFANMGDQAKLSTPLGFNQFTESSIHVEECKENSQAEGNTFEDGADTDFPTLSGKDVVSAFDETPSFIDETPSFIAIQAISSGSNDSQSADLPSGTKSSESLI